MAEEKCRTCKFYKRTLPAYGICRRYPPIVTAANTEWQRWPLVLKDDWCGDWVLTPEPIPQPGEQPL